MINFLQELATSTVLTAPSPATTGTTLTVQTGEGTRFGTLVPFTVIAHPDNELPTVDNAEFLYVTDITGDTLTVQREWGAGIVSTSAKSIAVGWRVSLPVTSDDVKDSIATAFIIGDAAMNYAVGDVLGYDSGGFYKAQADSAITSEVVGIVELRNDDYCRVVANGFIRMLHTYSGVVTGDPLFLSPDTAGDMTATEPTTPGEITKPIMIATLVGGGQTEGYVNIMRGLEVGAGWETNSFISDATPSGSVDGSNTAFTVPSPTSYTTSTLEVFINGLKQTRGTDYTETTPSSGTFTMTVAPISGDIVRVNYMQGSFGTGNADTVDGYHASDLLTPVGGVIDYAGATAPTGWLLCYGQAVSRTTYASLFTAIGTTYGSGDGSTTFNIPDIRGRVVAGQDDMGGTSADRLTNPGSTGGMDGDVLGGAGGQEAHVQTTAELASHTHHFDTRYNAGGLGANEVTRSNATGTVDSSSNFAANTGSSTAFNVVQPTIILNKIIRAL